ARWPDIGRATLARLVRPVGVGDQRAGEPDEIARALGDRGFRLRRRGEAADRHYHLPASGRTDLLVNVEKWCAPEMHVRHVVLQAVCEVALAVGEIVERTVPRQSLCDVRSLVGIDATLDALVARHLEADDEIRAARRPDCASDLLHE